MPKKLKLTERICGGCDGLGTVDANDEWTGYREEDCTECGGSGTVYDNKKFAKQSMLIFECVL